MCGARRGHGKAPGNSVLSVMMLAAAHPSSKDHSRVHRANSDAGVSFRSTTMRL
jgi:hypothetical protein